jgi:hypothetical protein
VPTLDHREETIKLYWIIKQLKSRLEDILKNLPAVFTPSYPSYLAIAGNLQPVLTDDRFWYVSPVNQGVNVNVPALVAGIGEFYRVDPATPGAPKQLAMS